MLIVPTIILAIEDEDDRAYMEWVFLTYHRLMYYYITKTLSDNWSADDAMQECLVHLIDKIDLLRSLSEAKRRSYIITTAKNTSISIVRREKKGDGCSYDEWAQDVVGTGQEDDPEALILHQSEIEQLHLIWDKLDERSKFLLSGRYILEQSFEELAKDLGVKPSSVRMMLSRAKQAAIQLIREHENPGCGRIK